MGFKWVVLKYATEWFVAPSDEYNSKCLPPPIEQLVRDVCYGLFEFGLVGRSFSKEEFTNWLRIAADVWKGHIYRRCVSIDGDGAEYMFGDSPNFTYHPELDSKDQLRHLVPPFNRHYHLGFNDSATSTLKTLWSSGVALHHLLGKRIIPFLNGEVMLQELGAIKKFSPQLSFSRAKHEGALGLEVAFHIDLPISQIEVALGLVDIRFLDESTPIIVRSQGSSFDVVERKAVLLRGGTKTSSLFIEKLDSFTRRDDRKQMFIDSRRVACSEVGVRQATDAAVFAALIILKELGFKQVCGVSDCDQGALLDRRDAEGPELKIYDPLFARLGFCPPMINKSRFWTFNLEELRMWNGEHDVHCEGLEDYFARVLARKASFRDSECDYTWDPQARLNANSKQLGKFSGILLNGAISLANSIKSGKEC
jgi:hypothetical protein